jgi:signal recognition particle subunit SRP54
VLSLIEQAERTMDQDVTTKGAAAIMEGRFTLEDFLEQLQQVRKMGSISGVLSMLPGMSKDLKQASESVDDRQIDQVEAIIHSMTPAERIEPSVIDGSRRVRIANGSGTTTADVNALLKQFKEMQKMMKGFAKGGMGGALGGLLGRGGPKLSPKVMADMAAMRGDLPGPGAGGPDGPANPFAATGGSAGGSGGGSKKGKSGKKGKGGGRVTPKAR